MGGMKTLGMPDMQISDGRGNIGKCVETPDDGRHEDTRHARRENIRRERKHRKRQAWKSQAGKEIPSRPGVEPLGGQGKIGRGDTRQ